MKKYSVVKGVFVFVFAACITLLAGGWSSYQRSLKASVIEHSVDAFSINKGASLNAVIQQLLEHNIEIDPFWFKVIAYQKKIQNQLKAGEYELSAGMTTPQLLALFVSGKSRQYAITFPEGWNISQLLHALAQDPNIKKTFDYSNIGTIMQVLGSKEAHPEGWFFPETYFFEKNTRDIDILQRAKNKMDLVLQEEWAQREADLPLKTPYEALILASIVEKETAAPSERTQIAGVFIRRLRMGMLLQTDPTVIYGMGERYKGNIRRKDLREATPYNTYVISGLPPTPIAMPGREAIHAVLHPAKGKTLYFVSRGDGTHVFSENLQQHNRAVNKFQRKSR